MTIPFRSKLLLLVSSLLIRYPPVSKGFVVSPLAGRTPPPTSVACWKHHHPRPGCTATTELYAQRRFDPNKNWFSGLQLWKQIRSFFRRHLRFSLRSSSSSLSSNSTAKDDDVALVVDKESDANDSATNATSAVDVEIPEEQIDVNQSHSKTPDDADGCSPQPQGPRWAVAAPTTNLSGTWKPIITPSFKQQYDSYLQNCGEGVFFRKALLSAIGFSKEIYNQRDQGRELAITGWAPVGGWERILIASGADTITSNFEPAYATFKDPDGEMVQVEAWWENNGTVHKSWLRNKPRVLGGAFETTRYLLPEDDNVLVCESVFHPPPNNTKFQKDRVEWRFQRE